MIPDQLPTDEEAKEFMLAEYQTLREIRNALDANGDSRLNFFLGVVSAALVALTLLNQSAQPGDVIYLVNAAVWLGLLALGFFTFARLVERSLNLIRNARGLNRVRRYFVDRHPDLLPYISLPMTDDRPSFDYALYSREQRRIGWQGLAPLVMLINSLIAVVGVVAFARIAFGANVLWSVLVGMVTFIIPTLMQHRYMVGRYKQRAKSEAVRFPSTK